MKTFGPIESQMMEQMEACVRAEEGSIGVLCADNHLGYSMPIGGVIAYEHHISPSAVGYDIGCGNMACRTDLQSSKINISQVMDRIQRELSFGMGRSNRERVDASILDEINECANTFQKGLIDLARNQLGTIGSGNHYVDLFEDSKGFVWIGVHFGSRGFGHKTASWALERMNVTDQGMMAPPVLIPLKSELGQLYLDGMERAGRYAYAGREWVIWKVLCILGASSLYEVHNHHNFAWFESHSGRNLLVHRKGATPAFPGQRGFVGSTMGDFSVILEGIASQNSGDALFSTVHGAGRVISRTKAAGKFKKGKQITQGSVDLNFWLQEMKDRKIELRGAGADEMPECYKNLSEVLEYHEGTIKVIERLRPIGVCMAGRDTFDPYKD